MSGPLSNLQKREIAIAARKAYDVWAEREPYEAINSEISRTACFDAWRHVETGKAAGGIQSLCQLSQQHYGAVLAHFQALGGRQDAATRTLARDRDNGRRIARYKLGQALRERGLEVGYATAICHSKFKCALDDASENQLWKIFFDVRNRKRPAPKLSQSELKGNPF